MKYPKSTMMESRLVVTQGWNEEGERNGKSLLLSTRFLS